MRQKRAKAYRKLMHLYCMSFGFRQPYQILADSEMCKSAVSQSLDFTKQLYTVLQGEVKPMITQCCIHELYLQGREQQAAVDLAKKFERRKCNHREPIPGDDCLQSVIGETNKHRYIVATQSHPLRVKLRSIPATPLIHINRSVMVLEPPSDATLQAKARTEEQKLHAGASDFALLGPSTTQEEQPKRRKGPKGPNPLSVKKKKTNEAPRSDSQKKAVVDEEMKAGAKRKAAYSDDEREDQDNDQSPNLEAESQSTTRSSSKKRKRRRKAGNYSQDVREASNTA